jgi:hypothetical protein
VTFFAIYSLLFVRRETPVRQGPWCGSGRLAAAVTSHGPVFFGARDARVKPGQEPSTLAFFDLAELQFHWCRAPEDRHRDLQARARVVDLFDHAIE